MKSSWVSRNNSANSKSLDKVRPEVSLASGLYMVKIGIGNNDSRGYFRQDAPLFDWHTSLTYQALPANCSHPFCKKYGYLNVGGFCGYRVRYADGAGSVGILATEKLTVNADNGLEGIDNFVFGCGLRQNEPDFGKGEKGENPIAGIFGLGGGEESFTRQLGDQIVVGGQGVHTTSIVPVRGDTIYYGTMEGISVGGEPVVYPEGSSVFEARSDGTGGCIFDSGCAVTQLSTPVYDPLRNLLIKFFYETYKIRAYDKPLYSYELCFQRPNEFSAYPTITFHYSGANFDIQPRAAFKVGNKVFCLNIARTKLINSYSVILGARQQVNHRILHDLDEKKISWANENCSMLG